MIFTPCRERGRNKPGIGNVPDPFRTVVKWRPEGSGLCQTILESDHQNIMCMMLHVLSVRHACGVCHIILYSKLLLLGVMCA